jgi:hypothetical protein
VVPPPADVIPQAKVNMINPSGDLVTMPSELAKEAVQQGYELVSEEQAKQQLKEETYGTFPEKLKAAAEGALSATTFGLGTGLEVAAGVEPEAIMARREVSPGARLTGELAGLVGTSLLVPGGGAAGAMEAAGAAVAAKTSLQAAKTYEAAQALKLAKDVGVGIQEAQAAVKAAKAAEPFLIKVGSEAANQAVQGAIMSAGDEVSKMFLQDPSQSVGTAISDIGLGGLIGGVTGGAIGSISPLWDATVGPKLATQMERFKNRADGFSVPVESQFETFLKDADPVVKAAMSGDEDLFKRWQTVMESGGSKGDAIRAIRDEFQDKLKSRLAGTVLEGEGLTAYEAGLKALEQFEAKEAQFYDVAEQAYSKVADIKKIEVPDIEKILVADKLMLSANEKFADEEIQIFKNYAEKITKSEDIGRMKILEQKLGSEANVAYRAGNWEQFRAFKEIKDTLRDFQEEQIVKQTRRLAKETGDPSLMKLAEEAIQQGKDANSKYAEYKSVTDEILGLTKTKAKSHGQFETAIEKVEPAQLANRLFKKDKIKQINLLKENFPEVLDALVTQQKTQLLDAATKSGVFNEKTLLHKINELPKEIQNIIFKPGELDEITAGVELLRKTNQRIGPSGTPRGLDTLWAKLPAGVGGLTSFLMGHNPLVGYLAGEVAHYVGRDLPDAINLGLLKFLGSHGEVSPSGFKALIEYTNAIYKGEKAVTKAAKQIFSEAPPLAVQEIKEQDRARKRLEKKIDELSSNPEELFNTGGDTSVYVPNHTQEMAKTALNTINYLNSLKPKQEKQTFLDSKPMVNKVAESRYNRALDIANNPLIVLDSIKKGTITQNDVNDLQAMFPGAYQNMQNKVMMQITNLGEEDKNIPYQTRLGLSVFMGQPLDSTMQPQSIMAAQNPVAPGQMQGQTIPGQKPKHSFTSLNKMPGMYQTPGQARQANKLGQ